jgi:hypothetical protein
LPPLVWVETGSEVGALTGAAAGAGAGAAGAGAEYDELGATAGLEDDPDEVAAASAALPLGRTWIVRWMVWVWTFGFWCRAVGSDAADAGGPSLEPSA